MFTFHSDVRDENNQTPLHLACEWGHKEVVQYLVEKGKCDIGVTDDDGDTPLDIATKKFKDMYLDQDRGRRYFEIVEYLKSSSTDQSTHVHARMATVKHSQSFRGREGARSPHIYPRNTTSLLKEGALYKRQRGRKSHDLRGLRFQQRYCVLTSTMLAYYGSKRDVGHEPSGSLQVAKIRIVEKVPDTTFKKPFIFQVGTEKEVVYFGANSDRERDEWIEAFRIAAFELKKNQPLPHYHDGAFGKHEKNHWSCCDKIGKEALGCVKSTVSSDNTQQVGPLETDPWENIKSPSVPVGNAEFQPISLSELEEKLASGDDLEEQATPSFYSSNQSIQSEGTPLSEEDSDALQMLLQGTNVSLPSRQVTFEEVQQLLFEKGHKEVARNLRAKLDKAINKQQQYLERLESLMTDKNRIELRYLKMFLVGPPGVGKTTTLNRLLKFIRNISLEGDKGKPLSTLLANCLQVFAFVRGDGTDWLASCDLNQETKLLFRYLCGCALEVVHPLLPEQTDPKLSDLKHVQQSQPKIMSEEPSQPTSVTKSKTVMREVSKECTRAAERNSRIHSIISKIQNLIKSEDHSILRDLIGSTLLNIADIGGQPGFLEMLPALSIGPAMYLVFFDLSKKLNQPYKIPFNREDTVIMPYDAVHTVEATISQILSAITSVHCTSSKSSQVNISRSAEFGKHFQSSQRVEPVATLIGTHKDQLSGNVEVELDRNSRSLSMITSRYSKVIAHPDSSRSFFAIDNLTGTDECDVGPLRDFLSKIFQGQFKDASLPICPKWLFLSLILRREYKIVRKLDCMKLAELLEMDREETEFAVWYLHFCTGTLMHYPEVSEWFKNHIICSPQVVFDSISELIVACMRSLHTKGPFKEYEKKEMIEMGQFSLESIEKYCACYEVRKKLEREDLIPAKQLVKLLNHVNLLSPITHKEPDGSERITYFMPAVLDCASLDDMTTPPPPDADNPEPLFITFKCGYVPTGSFCGLITRLVSLGQNEIHGLTWKLVEKGVKRNLVYFTVDDVHTVILLCHDRSYEVRVTRGEPHETLHDLCTHVRSVILDTLSALYSNLVPQVSFQCPCPFPDQTKCHFCIRSQGKRVRFLCERSKKCINYLSNEWLCKDELSGNSKEGASSTRPLSMQEATSVVRRPHKSDSSALSLDCLMKRTGVTDKQLDRECSEKDLSDISEHVIQYRKYGPKLGLSEADIVEVEANPHFYSSIKLKSEAVLKKWRTKNPIAATFRVLVEVALEKEDGAGAVKICEICAKGLPSEGSSERPTAPTGEKRRQEEDTDEVTSVSTKRPRSEEHAQ